MLDLQMNAEKKYILAIDHGTSAMKPALVSTDGEVLGFECEDTPLYLKPGGGAEQNPDEWWKAFLTAYKKLLDNELVPIEDIIAVCCSSQWSGTVAVDADGNHLMNAITWMDTRGAPYVEKRMRGLIKIEGYPILALVNWLRKTGGIPTHSGKDPIAHILFIKNEYPEIYDRTHKFLEPKDYVNLKLSGEFAASYDSITLHWVTDNRDINNIKYDKGLAKRIGVDLAKLPLLKNSTDVLGNISREVVEELGLNRETKVVNGSPDVPSAIIGSGAVNDYEGHIYVGTSSWLICHCPFKKTDIFHNIASIPSAIPGRYFVVNEQETAGACLTFLRDNLFYPDDQSQCGNPGVYQEFDRIVEEVPPGSNKVIFTPWMYGERTPVEDHTVRATFTNVSLNTTRGDIIRAVFEGVAFNSRQLLHIVEKFIKREFKALNFIGGGAQSNIWCQIFADVTNRPIRQVEDPIQANARGAAFIAAVGLGHIQFEDVQKLIKIAKTYYPNPENREIYDELYEEFLGLYKNNRKMFSRLNA